MLLEQNPKIRFLVRLVDLCIHEENKELVFGVMLFLAQKEKDVHENISTALIDIRGYLEKAYGFSLLHFRELGFYEAMEYAVKQFDLAPESDAHIMTFMDTVLEFTLKHGSNHLAFLDYWDKKRSRAVLP